MNALEGLSVWNRSCDLAVETYACVRQCSDRNFRDHITRALLAVPSSIAEGYERNSTVQLAQYLKIAKCSCAELRTQLYIAAELDLITLQSSSKLMQESVEISKMLQGLTSCCERKSGEA